MTKEERAYNYASTRKATKFQVGEVAKFYNDGYEQAEKDLALTWEDIDRIIQLWITDLAKWTARRKNSTPKRRNDLTKRGKLMRCAECGLYECAMRTPLGGCMFEGAKLAEQPEIVAAPSSTGWMKESEIINVPATATKPRRTLIDKERLTELQDVARSLVEAVERYVCPKKGDKYMSRTELLRIKNQLKELI